MNCVLEWGSSMGESQYLWEPCPEWIIHDGSKLLATPVGKPFMWTGADADPAQKKCGEIYCCLVGSQYMYCKCILYHAGNTLIWHRFCGLPTVRQPQVGRMNSTSPVANWSSPWQVPALWSPSSKWDDDDDHHHHHYHHYHHNHNHNHHHHYHHNHNHHHHHHHHHNIIIIISSSSSSSSSSSKNMLLLLLPLLILLLLVGIYGSASHQPFESSVGDVLYANLSEDIGIWNRFAASKKSWKIPNNMSCLVEIGLKLHVISQWCWQITLAGNGS